jgi:multicomponent Na+:H+ antiporter subunit C
MNVLLAIGTGVMFGLGVFQLLRRDLVKAAMGFYILFTAINLFILASGVFDGAAPAYVEAAERGQISDPVTQALILTAIVISFGSYALLLGMINVAANRFHSVDSDQIDELKG